MRAYLLTMEYQVVQFLPDISISEQFESRHVTILQQVLFLLLCSGGHRCMEWILCRVVESSYSPTHNIVPHTSLHDQPCHKTLKKYEDFEGMVIFLLLPRKFAIRTWFCFCPQYLFSFQSVFEHIPSIHDPRKDVGSPKSTSLLSSFHIGSRFCFFPANFSCHPHTQIRRNPFHGVRISIPKRKIFPPTVFQ